MPTLDPSTPISLGFQRSAGSIQWFDPDPQASQDPMAILLSRFAEFNEKVAQFEELAGKHFVNNPDATSFDARQHRWVLHYLLYQADDLALGFLILRRPDETAPYVTFLDDRIKRLLETVQQWHGDPEVDPDIPESFKDAMREVASGQVEEMEDDLFAVDAREKA